MTVTVTVPAAWAGALTVILVVDVTCTVVPAVPPKLTVVDPMTKPVPVRVTLVPAAVLPAEGETAVTVGAAVS